MCRNSGVACGGYEKSIFFDFEGSPDATTVRFRRPLLTESERKCMSERLTSSVPPRLALWHISQIDEECEEAPPAHDVQVCHGPFGAFRLSQRQIALSCDTSTEESEETCHPSEFTNESCASDNFMQLSDDILLPPDAALTPRTQQMFQSFLDHPGLSPLSPNLDMWNIITSSDRVQEVFDDIEISMPEIQQSNAMPPTPSQNFSFPHFISGTHVDHLSSPNAVSIAPSIDSAVPHDAVFLVKHYSTVVLRLLTPFRHSKTPWHVLFIPHAKNCLAALTLGESMDYANLCAFYGTLAVSAFSLGRVSQSLSWLEQGKLYKRQAGEHAEHMLQIAYNTPKTAKYKSILIALLTMVQLSMVSGDRDQTECYFLEAEKFIRVKGLNRRKSRKVRLLHHLYVFERMFHESTFIDSIGSNRRNRVRRAIESSGARAYSLDSLSFRLSDWNNLEQEMLRIKGQEEGENDLFLELPGIWSATLYPEIFAIPERYIFLLSLVIRLGKEMDGAEDQTSTSARSLKEFMGRAKAVERCINQLRHSRHTGETSNAQQDVPQQLPDNLLDAMQHALAIYFYRRIYDVDPLMLQPKVLGIRDCLMRFESGGSDYGAVRLIWPAFMAACEAEDPEIQATFSNWFQHYAERSGLGLFTDAHANIERIWAEKHNADGRNVTWSDLMRTSLPLIEHT